MADRIEHRETQLRRGPRQVHVVADDDEILHRGSQCGSEVNRVQGLHVRDDSLRAGEARVNHAIAAGEWPERIRAATVVSR